MRSSTAIVVTILCMAMALLITVVVSNNEFDYSRPTTQELVQDVYESHDRMRKDIDRIKRTGQSTVLQAE